MGVHALKSPVLHHWVSWVSGVPFLSDFTGHLGVHHMHGAGGKALLACEHLRGLQILVLLKFEPFHPSENQ